MRDRCRAAQLLEPPRGENLIEIVAREALTAQEERWCEGKDMHGCSRAIASFPLSLPTFEALFNGCSGYRAQYYLSCIEGIVFNAGTPNRRAPDDLLRREPR